MALTLGKSLAQTMPSMSLEKQLRERIESLDFLPTTVSVAMRFVELGQNPEAEPADYAKVLSADSSLSSKLLGLTNSSWHGVRHKVTTVKAAVNLLGLGTIRSLAISYCMTGIHNELGLNPEESRMFWEASLCKAVAAREYCKLGNEKLSDQAFLAAMLQDFAVTAMYAVGGESFLTMARDSNNSVPKLLAAQRECFGMDHAEAGRALAQKLEIPDDIVDVIAFHHDHTKLCEYVEQPHLANAVYVASLFPHLLNAWNSEDADKLCQFLSDDALAVKVDSVSFLATTQEEFAKLYEFFEDGSEPSSTIPVLMRAAAREAADQTTYLVGTVQQLLQQAAASGEQLHKLLEKQTTLEQLAERDPLTGVFNRVGFNYRAEALLDKAKRYEVGIAVVYVDVDRFKSVNDEWGHDFGDAALRHVAERMKGLLRQHDLVVRVGGDEFVFLLYDCGTEDAEKVSQRLLEAVACDHIGRGERKAKVTISAGCIWLGAGSETPTCDDLFRAADSMMYKAKRSGGNCVELAEYHRVEEDSATS